MPGFNGNLIIFVLIPLLPSIIFIIFIVIFSMHVTTYKNLTNLHESPLKSPLLLGGGEQELIFELKRGPGESPCFLGFPAVIPEMDRV